ncbi:DNA helicase PIF1, ATP-dependent [Tanacetum coccineum]
MVTHAFNIKNSMSMLVQKLQDHKMMIRDYAWLMISRSSRSHLCQVKDRSQSLKSKITTSIHKLKIEVKGYELKTKVKAYILQKCSANSILGSEDEHSDLPPAIANIVGTIYTLELKSYTYYEHGTYESFTCWKVVIEEVVEESASSGMVAANAGSKAPVLKGLTKTLSVATPLKPCAERKQKSNHVLLSVMPSGNNPDDRPSLSNILHTSVMIHSNRIIRRDGKVQSFCGLKLLDIGMPNTGSGTSSMPAKGDNSLKGQAIASTTNGSVQKRTAQKARKLAALASVGTEVSYNNLGAPSYQCCSCQATMWFEERNNKANRTANPTFSLCCQEARIDHSINVGRGLYTFRINGQNYHRIGPLLLKQGTQPSPIAKAFRMARDWCHSHTSMHVELPLLSERTNARQYNAPTVAEVPAWITNDIGDDEPTRNIIYLVDAYTAIIEQRLSWRRINQDTLRVDLYHNGRDVVKRGDTNAVGLGKRIVLPHTFTGGPMYMMQNYQDAIALCHANGNLDLFITFTSNLKWPEINEMLAYVPGQRARDRPEVGTKVFKLKLTELLKDLAKNQVFGVCRAVVYVIEFQKLLHAHILLWLKNHCKCKTLVDIDDIISAELPSLTNDPAGYKVVTDYILPGPCGKDARYVTCNIEGKCSKHFPKPFYAETIIDEDGYPI